MKPTLHQACLLLGSNIEPEKNLPLAVSLLQKQLTILQASSVWESKAVGSDGPNMLNAALLITTSLDVENLKGEVLRPLEAQLGRIRTSDKNAPRTIDLDILLFDALLVEPGLWKSVYRAVPVAEILPDYPSESEGPLKGAAERLKQTTPIWVREDVSLLAGTRFKEEK